MVTYTVEKMADILDEFKDLCVHHWREIANYKDEIALDPDWGKYLKMEEIGMLVVITARDHDILVGYSVFIVTPHLHYRQCVVAMNDLIFILPDRRGYAGAKLILESHRVMVALGADRIMWHIKPRNDWSSVLGKMGYKQEEIMMGIYISKRN